MTSNIVRVVCGGYSVTYDPGLPPMLRFTVRGWGGRIVRLRAPYGEAHRALVHECGLTKTDASRLLDQASGGES
ncbi:hypothetical protein CDO52_21790 [Nocardiopsis gilva YIM 90087]|uniref:Uncharacterized protein n=1 Tax=Nocardiopsis gilva YIM 90087 TaxID=1235441 RepID=A0A223SAE3_9ACTN|nr:hypothetical protein [Nocardiopsis gilva]ASU85073.1 hypothetical protein CDO52_21790 [Nocardiopsis gilva YIM 90087]